MVLSKLHKRKAPGLEVNREKRQQAKENQESVPWATALEEALILEEEGKWPQMDNGNAREDGSPSRCYTRGHVWTNMEGKSATRDLNGDSVKR